jgi:hypothetical protein
MKRKRKLKMHSSKKVKLAKSVEKIMESVNVSARSQDKDIKDNKENLMMMNVKNNNRYKSNCLMIVMILDNLIELKKTILGDINYVTFFQQYIFNI